jgi:hypothetical protein
MVTINLQHSARKMHLTDREPILLQWSDDNFSKLQVSVCLGTVRAFRRMHMPSALSQYAMHKAAAVLFLQKVSRRCSHFKCLPGLYFNRYWRKICETPSQHAKNCSTASRERGRISRLSTVWRRWQWCKKLRPMIQAATRLDTLY